MPDVLYMSATPIPRTYALTIYVDMDVSIIKEMPKGRIPVKTYVKNDKEIKDILELMYEELKEKHQIYVIAPLIEESTRWIYLASLFFARIQKSLSSSKVRPVVPEITFLLFERNSFVIFFEILASEKSTSQS